MKETSVIITAGGVGKRMGTEIPKQFLLLAGQPILMRTLQQMQSFLPEAQFIITLPEEWKIEWKRLCKEHMCNIPHDVVSGGTERFHSVKNALEKCIGENILIHDGVRPLVNKETVNRGMNSLKTHASSVPVLEIVESMRKRVEDINQSVNRSQYVVVQTPQCFHRKEIVRAYEVDFDPNFTDDASVLERAGHEIFLFEGNRENVKITQQSDLGLAEHYWSMR